MGIWEQERGGVNAFDGRRTQQEPGIGPRLVLWAGIGMVQERRANTLGKPRRPTRMLPPPRVPTIGDRVAKADQQRTIGKKKILGDARLPAARVQRKQRREIIGSASRQSRKDDNWPARVRRLTRNRAIAKAVQRSRQGVEEFRGH